MILAIVLFIYRFRCLTYVSLLPQPQILQPSRPWPNRVHQHHSQERLTNSAHTEAPSEPATSNPGCGWGDSLASRAQHSSRSGLACPSPASTPPAGCLPGPEELSLSLSTQLKISDSEGPEGRTCSPPHPGSRLRLDSAKRIPPPCLPQTPGSLKKASIPKRPHEGPPHNHHHHPDIHGRLPQGDERNPGSGWSQAGPHSSTVQAESAPTCLQRSTLLQRRTPVLCLLSGTCPARLPPDQSTQTDSRPQRTREWWAQGQRSRPSQPLTTPQAKGPLIALSQFSVPSSKAIQHHPLPTQTQKIRLRLEASDLPLVRLPCLPCEKG